MNKKILEFLVALLSFMAIIPIHSDVLAALPVLPLPISTDLASRVGAMTEYFSGQPRLLEIDGHNRRVLVVGRIDGNIDAFNKIYAKVDDALSWGAADSVVFLGNYLSLNHPEGNAYVLDGLSRLYERYTGHVFILRGSHESKYCLERGDFFTSREHEFLKRFLESLPCAAIVNNSTFLAYGTMPADVPQFYKLLTFGRSTSDDVRYNSDYKNIVAQLTCGQCFRGELQTLRWNIDHFNLSLGAVSGLLEYVRGAYPNYYRYGGYGLSNLCYAVFGDNTLDSTSYSMSEDGCVTLFRSGPGSSMRPYDNRLTIVAIDGNLPPRFYCGGAFEPNSPSYYAPVPAPAPVPATAAPGEDSSWFGRFFGWLLNGK